MTRKVLILASAIGLFITACKNKPTINTDTKNIEINQTAKLTDVTFSVANNYFVKNTVTKLENPKLETQQAFDSIFGMATKMGKEGTPTAIDFSKQNVIALVLPQTDIATTVEPVSLQKNEKGELTLNYKVKVGENQTFTSVPSFAIIVDKLEAGALTMNEIK